MWPKQPPRDHEKKERMWPKQPPRVLHPGRYPGILHPGRYPCILHPGIPPTTHSWVHRATYSSCRTHLYGQHRATVPPTLTRTVVERAVTDTPVTKPDINDIIDRTVENCYRHRPRSLSSSMLSELLKTAEALRHVNVVNVVKDFCPLCHLLSV